MARKREGLSDRHRKIMEYLTEFIDEFGYSPSIREIGDAIDVKSTSLVDYYLNQLEEREYISREGRISRSIRVLKPMRSAGKAISTKVRDTARAVTSAVDNLVSIPLRGRIVASAPLPMPTSDFNYFDPESGVEIARSLLPAREKVNELFALEVQGDSMIDAMVNDGDLIIIRPSNQALNGEMVAVWLDDKDETTLKYFYKEKNRVRLQPANPTMDPIYVDNPDELRIMGKVVMVIRQYKSEIL
ncbi:MAG TPA: transcriptional repressor LexA [Anaerolineaceae bacterium]|nr:transcriptional repressor LexA [Anaerolineaceae bacterium]